MAAPTGADETIGTALDRAALVFREWGARPVAERRRCVRSVRTSIVARQYDIARTVTEETGKPITEVVCQEITASLEMLRHAEHAYPRWLKDRRFRYLRPGFWSKSNVICYEPLGVVAVVGPSNYPFSLPMMQTCVALLCGNCVAIKPSERCPRTAELLRRVFSGSSLPEGVVTVIEGSADVVEQIIEHDAIRKVIFTGRYETGRRIAAMCGAHFRPCVLELGGDGAAIVCDDADVALAAKGIAWGAFHAKGTSCIGTRRVYVHRTAYGTFLRALRDEIRDLRVGDPLDASTDVGSNAGAPLGIGQLDTAVIVSGENDRTPREEAGGPALFVCEVASLDEAIRKANDSLFGLGASVWSRSSKLARSIARELRVGMVWVNDTSVGQPKFPWGGTKASGWGRLFSREALTELTHVKVISHDRGRGFPRRFWWFPYTQKKLDLLLAVNEIAFGTVSVSRLIGRIRGAPRSKR